LRCDVLRCELHDRCADYTPKPRAYVDPVWRSVNHTNTHTHTNTNDHHTHCGPHRFSHRASDSGSNSHTFVVSVNVSNNSVTYCYAIKCANTISNSNPNLVPNSVVANTSSNPRPNITTNTPAKRPTNIDSHVVSNAGTVASANYPSFIFTNFNFSFFFANVHSIKLTNKIPDNHNTNSSSNLSPYHECPHFITNRTANRFSSTLSC
jgi:hypothetical protein